MADKFGFGVLDDGETRRSLRRLGYIAGFGWALALAGVMTGLLSPLIGMVCLSLVFVVACGGLLISSQTNYELATMLATSTQDPLTARDPVASFTPPPLPQIPAEPARLAPPRASFQPPALPLPQAGAPPLQVLSKGEMAGRSYTIFSNGSIEIETAFGPRWFASVDLAHEFIGLRNGRSLRVVAAPELANVA